MADAPYGSWRPPITSDLITAESITLSGARVLLFVSDRTVVAESCIAVPASVDTSKPATSKALKPGLS